MQTPPSPGTGRRRWPLRALRAVLVVHLLVVLGQPLTAGRYLTGDVDAIAWHATTGSLLAAVGLALVAAALVHVLAGRGRWAVLAAAVGVFLADGVQIDQGFERALQVHVPLGVGIAVASVLFAAWAWTPAAGRTR